MKCRFITKYKNGFTLIELLISLALLSIIIMVAFNFLLFNHKVYNKSDSLSQVQFDVRMASDYITTNVRNANSISTVEDVSFPNSLGTNVLKAKYAFVKSIDFQIKSQGENYLLTYSIQGSDSKGENPYKLESEIILSNVNSAIASNGSIIYYSK